eukprot:TRINITY_DN14659_c0_g1_i1.p1 TRINITY_DN14659_c0_g1~~TRINITY_DN14659_c0_g1_i1.p1  ORF type:complete len:577 (+),score=282.86 TRINITY_DN14659_c0_g1_i1:57-1733(+)
MAGDVEAELWDIFALIDRDDSGTICDQELMRFLSSLPRRQQPTEETVHELILEFGARGCIDKVEFVGVVRKIRELNGLTVRQMIELFKQDLYTELFAQVQVDGVFSRQELRTVVDAVGREESSDGLASVRKNDYNRIFDEHDVGNTGVVDEKGFVAILERLGEGVPLSHIVHRFFHNRKERRQEFIANLSVFGAVGKFRRAKRNARRFDPDSDDDYDSDEEERLRAKARAAKLRSQQTGAGEAAARRRREEEEERARREREEEEERQRQRERDAEDERRRQEEEEARLRAEEEAREVERRQREREAAEAAAAAAAAAERDALERRLEEELRAKLRALEEAAREEEEAARRLEEERAAAERDAREAEARKRDREQAEAAAAAAAAAERDTLLRRLEAERKAKRRALQDVRQLRDEVRQLRERLDRVHRDGCPRCRRLAAAERELDVLRKHRCPVHAEEKPEGRRGRPAGLRLATATAALCVAVVAEVTRRKKRLPGTRASCVAAAAVVLASAAAAPPPPSPPRRYRLLTPSPPRQHVLATPVPEHLDPHQLAYLTGGRC